MPRVIAPLRDFLHRESSSGILILMASALGLLVANSPLADQYNSLLGFDFKFGISDIYVELTILKSINYVLMTIFFFVVGLEIKRELTSGHLASFKKAVMPFVAALGGMAVPALIYLAIAGFDYRSGLLNRSADLVDDGCTLHNLLDFCLQENG